jgi:hypothetical protein
VFLSHAISQDRLRSRVSFNLEEGEERMTLQTNLGALEFNGVIVDSDAALERIASAGPTTMGGCPTLMCRHSDDGALESAGARADMQPQTMMAQPWCRHIDDSRLEQAATGSAQPYTSPMNTACRHIDSDGALEAVGLEYEMGPKTIIIPGHPRCL